MQRGLDVRDFTLATFGGSGSLLLCRLVDVLGLAAVLVPRDPGNLSAFGLLTVDVRNDDVQTAVRRHRDLDPPAVERAYAELQARSAAALRQEGFAEPEHRFARSADLRYFGQAFEVRVPVADGPLDAEAVADAFHDAHAAVVRLQLPRRRAAAGRVGQPAGHRHRPDRPARAAPAAGARRRRRARPHGHPHRRVRRRPARRRSTGGPTCRPATSCTARRCSRSSARRSRCTPASAPRSTASATSASPGRPHERRRPRRRRDRGGEPRRDREGGRDGDRPDVALADDPRRPRLPRRHPRPPAAQAHRPVVLRARPPGGARLPARDHAPRRRLLPQRRLPVGGRDRPPARPLRHRPGVRRRRGGRVRAGLRPPRRHRRRLPRARCRAARPRSSRRGSWSRRSGCGTRASRTRRR